MALRPARTIAKHKGQVWARISQKVPRKSYVKGAPRPKIRQYDMGVDKRYEVEATLVCLEDVNIRDNALEAARQTAVKFLEKNILGGFFFKILKYPHLVIREHASLGVAGADRISKGMKLAFGKPKGRMVFVKKGEPLLRVNCYNSGLPYAVRALKKARLKLSGLWTIKTRDITNDKVNLSKSVEGVQMKKIVEEKPKEEVKAQPEAVTASVKEEAAKK
jgi:large subunit ribosomal protein L10e